MISKDVRLGSEAVRVSRLDTQEVVGGRVDDADGGLRVWSDRLDLPAFYWQVFVPCEQYQIFYTHIKRQSRPK